MRAVIMAGGKGKRLSPFTEVLPKPLLPIGGKPMIDIILRQLGRFHFDHVTISVNPEIRSLFESFKIGWGFSSPIRVDYVSETKPMGTVGALRLIPDLPSSFLVMNGDILTSLNFLQFFRYHESYRGLATIAMSTQRSKVDYGVIKTDYNQLVSYQEKPRLSYHVSMGVYCFKKGILNLIPEDERMDFPDLIKKIIRLKLHRKVYCYHSKAFWMDIGRPDDYFRARQIFPRIRGKLSV